MSARKFGVRFLGVSAVLLASLQAEGIDKSMDKSGAFIGAEVGYAAGFTRVDPIPTNQQQQTTTQGQNITYPYAALGLKAGYGYYFVPSFGVRAYASYHYGVNGSNGTSTEIEQGGGGSGGGTTTITTNSAMQSIHQVSANVEVVWDFVQLSQASIGVYAGLGAGYGSHTAKTTSAEGAQATITEANLGSGFILPVNIGLEVGIGKHHRAGLNFRIPTIAASFKDNMGLNATYTEFSSRNLITSVGYSYVF